MSHTNNDDEQRCKLLLFFMIVILNNTGHAYKHLQQIDLARQSFAKLAHAIGLYSASAPSGGGSITFNQQVDLDSGFMSNVMLLFLETTRTAPAA